MASSDDSIDRKGAIKPLPPTGGPASPAAVASSEIPDPSHGSIEPKPPRTSGADDQTRLAKVVDGRAVHAAESEVLPSYRRSWRFRIDTAMAAAEGAIARGDTAGALKAAAEMLEIMERKGVGHIAYRKIGSPYRILIFLERVRKLAEGQSGQASLEANLKKERDRILKALKEEWNRQLRTHGEFKKPPAAIPFLSRHFTPFWETHEKEILRGVLKAGIDIDENGRLMPERLESYVREFNEWWPRRVEEGRARMMASFREGNDRSARLVNRSIDSIRDAADKSAIIAALFDDYKRIIIQHMTFITTAQRERLGELLSSVSESRDIRAAFDRMEAVSEFAKANHLGKLGFQTEMLLAKIAQDIIHDDEVALRHVESAIDVFDSFQYKYKRFGQVFFSFVFFERFGSLASQRGDTSSVARIKSVADKLYYSLNKNWARQLRGHKGVVLPRITEIQLLGSYFVPFFETQRAAIAAMAPFELVDEHSQLLPAKVDLYVHEFNDWWQKRRDDNKAQIPDRMRRMRERKESLHRGDKPDEPPVPLATPAVTPKPTVEEPPQRVDSGTLLLHEMRQYAERVMAGFRRLGTSHSYTEEEKGLIRERDEALAHKKYERTIEIERSLAAFYAEHNKFDDAFLARGRAMSLALTHRAPQNGYRESALLDIKAQSELFRARKSDFHRTILMLDVVHRESTILRAHRLKSGLDISQKLELHLWQAIEIDMIWALGRSSYFDWTNIMPLKDRKAIIRRYRNFIMDPRFRTYHIERGYVDPQGMRFLAVHIMRDRDPKWKGLGENLMLEFLTTDPLVASHVDAMQRSRRIKSSLSIRELIGQIYEKWDAMHPSDRPAFPMGIVQILDELYPPLPSNKGRDLSVSVEEELDAELDEVVEEVEGAESDGEVEEAEGAESDEEGLRRRRQITAREREMAMLADVLARDSIDLEQEVIAAQRANEKGLAEARAKVEADTRARERAAADAAKVQAKLDKRTLIMRALLSESDAVTIAKTGDFNGAITRLYTAFNLYFQAGEGMNMLEVLDKIVEFMMRRTPSLIERDVRIELLSGREYARDLLLAALKKSIPNEDKISSLNRVRLSKIFERLAKWYEAFGDEKEAARLSEQAQFQWEIFRGRVVALLKEDGRFDDVEQGIIEAYIDSQRQRISASDHYLGEEGLLTPQGIREISAGLEEHTRSLLVESIRDHLGPKKAAKSAMRGWLDRPQQGKKKPGRGNGGSHGSGGSSAPSSGSPPLAGGSSTPPPQGSASPPRSSLACLAGYAASLPPAYVNEGATNNRVTDIFRPKPKPSPKHPIEFGADVLFVDEKVLSHYGVPLVIRGLRTATQPRRSPARR